MQTLIRRTFTVNVPLQTAWDHLARVEQWPSWAKHIKRVDLVPPGALTPDSTGVIHLRGATSAFRMTAFDPPRRWSWAGPLLWLTIHYDHQFAPVSDDQTRLTWIVACDGFGTAVLGRLFAAVYNRNLNRAIPNLIAEMETPGGDPAASSAPPAGAVPEGSP